MTKRRASALVPSTTRARARVKAAAKVVRAATTMRLLRLLRLPLLPPLLPLLPQKRPPPKILYYPFFHAVALLVDVFFLDPTTHQSEMITL